MAKQFNTDVLVNSAIEDPIERVLKETNVKGANVVIVACSNKQAQIQASKLVAMQAH